MTLTNGYPHRSHITALQPQILRDNLGTLQGGTSVCSQGLVYAPYIKI